MRKYYVRDINKEQALRDEALRCANKRLERDGIKFPLLHDYPNAIAYMDALESYRYKEQEAYRACLRELSSDTLEKREKKPKQIWSEIAYC